MKTRKKTKTKSLLQAEKDMELFLHKIGYTGKYKDVPLHTVPVYSTDSYIYTSNKIPSQVPKKQENVYSGNEIAGIVVSHKSNSMPIRRDNLQAAVDAATMRRN